MESAILCVRVNVLICAAARCVRIWLFIEGSLKPLFDMPCKNTNIAYILWRMAFFLLFIMNKLFVTVHVYLQIVGGGGNCYKTND